MGFLISYYPVIAVSLSIVKSIEYVDVHISFNKISYFYLSFLNESFNFSQYLITL